MVKYSNNIRHSIIINTDMAEIANVPSQVSRDPETSDKTVCRPVTRRQPAIPDHLPIQGSQGR